MVPKTFFGVFKFFRGPSADKDDVVTMYFARKTFVFRHKVSKTVELILIISHRSMTIILYQLTQFLT